MIGNKSRKHRGEASCEDARKLPKWLLIAIFLLIVAAGSFIGVQGQL